MKTNPARLFLIVLVLLWNVGSHPAESAPAVVLEQDQWSCKGDDASSRSGEASLRQAVASWLTAWVQRDTVSCRNLLAPRAVWVSQNRSSILEGSEQILKALPKEWQYYETNDHGASALSLEIRDVRAEIRGNNALVHFVVDASGGNLWDFDDTAAFLQVFSRSNPESEWRLAVSADAWNLTETTVKRGTKAGGFHLDYALPVADLARAVRFYQPFFGDPEAVTASLAVFEVKGSRLYLVTTPTPPATPIRKGLPNGWVILTPPDFDEAFEDGEAAEVEFPGSEEDFADRKILYGYEPAGNLLALARPIPGSLERPEPRLIRPPAPGSIPLQGQLQNVIIRTIGPWRIEARRRVITGPAPWNHREETLETIVTSPPSEKSLAFLTTPAAQPRGFAREFDYIGVPSTASRWKATGKALQALTNNARTYSDDGWKGFWGEQAVLGMFEADKDDDGIPRRQEASTYLSLLVESIDQATAAARKAGATFPRVPAINDKPGIDRMPGYTQVYLVDSEGNGLVLTEYTGRRRR